MMDEDTKNSQIVNSAGYEWVSSCEVLDNEVLDTLYRVCAGETDNLVARINFSLVQAYTFVVKIDYNKLRRTCGFCLL